MTAILPSSFLDAALIYASSRDADCSPGFDNTAFSRSSDIESFTSAVHCHWLRFGGILYCFGFFRGKRLHRKRSDSKEA